jgi:hypothetical protein
MVNYDSCILHIYIKFIRITRIVGRISIWHLFGYVRTKMKHSIF